MWSYVIFWLKSTAFSDHKTDKRIQRRHKVQVKLTFSFLIRASCIWFKLKAYCVRWRVSQKKWNRYFPWGCIIDLSPTSFTRLMQTYQNVCCGVTPYWACQTNALASDHPRSCMLRLLCWPISNETNPATEICSKFWCFLLKTELRTTYYQRFKRAGVVRNKSSSLEQRQAMVICIRPISCRINCHHPYPVMIEEPISWMCLIASIDVKLKWGKSPL